MKRPFLVPASAALIGILMAMGVFALKRAAENALSEHRFVTDVQVQTRGELVDLEEVLVEVDGARIEAEIAREALQRAREELQHSLESERKLTDAQRARILRALERLDAKLPLAADLAEAEVEASDAPDAPVTEANANSGETSANSGETSASSGN